MHERFCTSVNDTWQPIIARIAWLENPALLIRFSSRLQKGAPATGHGPRIRLWPDVAK